MDQKETAKRIFERVGSIGFLGTFLFLSTLWGLLMGAHLGLTDQESYYWWWSQNLQLGYYEHPPLQAWLTRLFTELLGSYEAWVVRLPATFGRILGLWFFYKWARLRLGPRHAEVSLWLLVTTFMVLAASWIALPDVVLFPGAMAVLYFSETHRLVPLGIALGMAALGKWHAALYVPGVVWALMMGTPSRPLASLNLSNIGTRTRAVITVGIISIVFQIPVLWWNFQNDWASFKFHLVSRHLRHSNPDLGLIISNLLGFGGTQLLLAGLSIVVLYIVVRIKGRSADRGPAASGRWAASLSWLVWILPFFLIFGWSAARGELRFYWTALAFPPLMAWAAHRLSGAITNSMLHTLRRVFFVYGLTLIVLISTLVLLPVGTWLKEPAEKLGARFDLRWNPRGDMDGWLEFADHLKNKNLWTPETLVVGSNFRISAQMAWALQLHDKAQVQAVLNPAMQMDLWNPRLEFPRQRALLFWDNRYVIGTHMNDACDHKIEWNRFDHTAFGEVIKEISWGICDRVQIRP